MEALIPRGFPQNILAWPVGMPQNNDQFVKDYGRFVSKAVARYNKVKRNMDDLNQHIWLKLVESDVLTKFAERYMAESLGRIPAEMDGQTAAAFLGVSWEQWLTVMRSRKLWSWLPKPASGKRTDEDAIWAVEALVTLDESGVFEDRPQLSQVPGTEPEKVKKTFQGYLSRTIHNHYANWCRSRSRKESSERLLPGGIRVEGGHSGGYYHNVEREDGQMSCWEGDLPATSPTPFTNPKKDSGVELVISVEDAAVIRTEFEAAGVPLDTEAGQNVLSVVLEKGYTIKEAILDQKTQTRRRVRVRQG